ncbi:MAG TPA: di-trans,poly-cis-decaprenylcistransferase [Gemmatimonadales bacterium]|nr:di-trans,poly-cis-decaprenylcistransferase [Gemmatimonadales bacterium]
MQSSSLHAGIIMDGNGRWAERRGLSRTAGHRAGARAVEALIEAAPDAGVGVLTLYAFSSDNWKRPMPEVAALMRLFQNYLRSRRARAVGQGVAVEVIGRRDRLPAGVLAEIAKTESATHAGDRLRVRLAVDYSARDAIVRAAEKAAQEPEPPTRERFDALIASVDHAAPGVPPLDLVIRTGGEQRLSDFMLWESAYAELFFLDIMWPDFTAGELDRVVTEFKGRERRFGGLPDRSLARGHLRLTR